MGMLDVFHAGERQVHHKVGVPDGLAARMARYVHVRVMPDQHRDFFQRQPILYAATLDAQGQPEAHILVGQAGLVSSPDAHTLCIQLARLLEGGHDVQRLQPGQTIGLLGLEFHTRRRSRVNGTVVAADSDAVTLRVDQSYGNCPKYIQKRAVLVEAAQQGPADGVASAVSREGALPPKQRQFVTAADTFFIASSAAATDSSGPAGTQGCDLSHRGGPPGFVHVAPDGSYLRWADYAGNNMFMTLGNLVQRAQVGLLFVDYEAGASLHVQGTARVLWDDVALPGAERTIDVTVSGWTFRGPGSLPLSSSPVFEWSPFNPDA